MSMLFDHHNFGKQTNNHSPFHNKRLLELTHRRSQNLYLFENAHVLIHFPPIHSALSSGEADLTYCKFVKHLWNFLLLSLCPAAQPQSVGLIAGTIATGVLAVIICSLLVVVTLFYWKNKNKYDEEEIPNEIRFGFDL